MNQPLTIICNRLRNWFYAHKKNGEAIYQTDDFTIVDEVITPVKIQLVAGAYLRIKGSVLNDGVYLIEDDLKLTGAINEAFSGTIILMSVPQQVVAIAKSIQDAIDAKAAASELGVSSGISDPSIISESFSGYSYTKASGGSSTGGVSMSWEDSLYSSYLSTGGILAQYMKMFEERLC